LPAITGWGLSKDFPRPAARPFRERFSELDLSPSTAPIELAARQGIHVQDGAEGAPAGFLNEAFLTARFSSELLALGGAFTLCNEAELAERILDLLSERGLDRLLSWEEDRLPPGLLAAIRSAGIEVIQAPDPGARVGLTGALAGIAETGSLLLPGGSGRPLAASLLPEIHLAVLFARDIKQNLQQALRLPEVRSTSSSVVVSGPSRTADIEMTLTIGVHGPGEIHVFCLEI
jgi:L-lactate dehydrogenase complex protein LldG